MADAAKKIVLATGCLGLLVAIGVPMNAAAGDPKKGKAVFDENCSMCHNATSTEVLVGPGLKGLFKRAKLGNGKPVNDANVLNTINNGGDSMPPLGDALKPADKDNIIAYLKTL
jgi:mono/diheme cytochrome c family protein